ncbi:sensor histidine kinase [Saccharibacillus sp. CPCC 101409]|uniref:PAS domain-containing sensor histidine kinase n=1 Tax=Saccharibacillus sp. CPCC 101409 TaxID=3058041 RepID=UPI0026735166|nr:sensor histidine kinase [Saccharibacillus sp. CPCC 101409]MDO3412350.1 sensor histidine kinase [Saccharibacillus sp. CPCC 101409]
MPSEIKQLNPLMVKLFENSKEAIFFFDKEGRALAMNPAAEEIVTEDVLLKMYQGREDALCGTCRGYTSDTEQRTCLDCYLQLPESEEQTSFQVYLETKGKGVVPYAGSFHTVDPENGTRVFMLRDLTPQLRVQERLHRNNMMKHVIEAQENERKRLSRELHDSVAQELMSAVVDLRVLKYMTDDETLLKKVKQTEASMTRLMDDIRNLSVELRPASLDDFGLEAAFRSHFKRIEQSYGLVVEFQSNLDRKRYDSDIETVLYRICQEAVLNALKYAQVDVVNVRLYEEKGAIRLDVEDGGEGFEQGSDPIGTGLGLYGMRERAELAGGTLSVHSEPGQGTRVLVQIPVPCLQEGE